MSLWVWWGRGEGTLLLKLAFYTVQWWIWKQLHSCCFCVCVHAGSDTDFPDQDSIFPWSDCFIFHMRSMRHAECWVTACKSHPGQGLYSHCQHSNTTGTVTKHGSGLSVITGTKHDSNQSVITCPKHDSNQSVITGIKRGSDQSVVTGTKHDSNQSVITGTKRGSNQSVITGTKHDSNQSVITGTKHNSDQSITSESEHRGQSNIPGTNHGSGHSFTAESEHRGQSNVTGAKRRDRSVVTGRCGIF